MNCPLAEQVVVFNGQHSEQPLQGHKSSEQSCVAPKGIIQTLLITIGIEIIYIHKY